MEDSAFSRGCNQGETSPSVNREFYYSAPVYFPLFTDYLFILQQVADFGEELFFGARCRRSGRCSGCGSSFSFFLLAHVLHETEEFLHQEEYGESDNQEVQDFADEGAVRNGDAFGGCVDEGLDAFACVLAAALGDDGGNGRHYDIADERIDNLAECGTDDDTDGHVDDVALECECFEFFNE